MVRSTDVHLAVTRDSAIYFAAKACPALAGLLLVALLLRFIGSAEFGRLAVVMSLANVLNALAGGWLNQSILRFESGASQIVESAVQSRLSRRVGLSAVVGILLGAALLVGGVGSAVASIRPLDIALACVLGAAMAGYYSELARLSAELRPMAVAVREALRGALAIALTVSVMTLSDAVPLLALALCGSYLLPLAPLAKDALTGHGKGEPRDQFKALKEYFGFGWSLSAWLGVMMMFPLVDRFALGIWVDQEAVGSYSAVYDLVVRGFGLLLMPVVAATHPRIMARATEGTASWAGVLRHAVLLQLVVFALVLTGAAVSGEAVLALLLGRGVAAEGVMIPLLVAAFIWQSALLVHKPLEVARRPIIMVASLSAALFLHAFMCRLWVPSLGQMGACLAFLFSGLAYTLLVGLAGWWIIRGQRTDA